nr:putative ribonuclease h protein [Quercus suber]
MEGNTPWCCGTVRDCIEGPLQKDEAGLRVCDIYTNGIWELHKLSFLLPPLLSQAIKATPLRNASTSEDRLSWIASPRGEFDSKGAYLIACGANTGDECFKGAWLWKLKTFLKIHMFLWKCYHNSILVKTTLAQRGIPLSPTCDMCHDQPETTSHVLRDCKTARDFWAESNWPNEVLHTFDLEVLDWIKANACYKVLAKGRSYPWSHFFLLGIWHLWLNRNKLMFQPLQSHQNLYKLVEAQVYEFWFCVHDHVEPRRRAVIAVDKMGLTQDRMCNIVEDST